MLTLYQHNAGVGEGGAMKVLSEREPIPIGRDFTIWSIEKGMEKCNFSIKRGLLKYPKQTLFHVKRWFLLQAYERGVQKGKGLDLRTVATLYERFFSTALPPSFHMHLYLLSIPRYEKASIFGQN